jgi:predicted transcriptional regulator
MKIPLLESQLSRLEQRGEISVVQENGTLRYYPKKRDGEEIESSKADTRKKIYDLIAQQPGLHISKIAKILIISHQLTEYHLFQMEKENLITSVKLKTGYFKRYYIKESGVGFKEKRILALLRQEHLLKIILYLYRYPNITHRDLVKKLKIAPSTLSYHLGKLLDYDLIDFKDQGREREYILKYERELIWTIRKYKLHRLIEGFADLWKDLNIKKPR